jgi:uncharacterized protein (TIGR03435 family)
MDSDHYDISDKAEKPVTREEILRMLQSLLSERFRLTVRRTTKELRVMRWLWHGRMESLVPNLQKLRRAAAWNPTQPTRLRQIPRACVATGC